MKAKKLAPYLILLIFVVLFGAFVTLGRVDFTSKADKSKLTISNEKSDDFFILRNDLLQYKEPLASYGVAVGDADQDGDPDIWLTQHGGGGSVILRNKLNEELGTFENLQIHAPGDQHSAAWVDLDRDGKREVLILMGGGKGGKTVKPIEDLGNRIFINKSTSTDELTFIDMDDGDSEADSRGLYYSHGRGRTASFIDANNDGLLDVFIGNSARPDGAFPSALFYQGGDNNFSIREQSLGNSGHDIKLASLADFNGDGRMDFFLSSEKADNAVVLGKDDKFVADSFPLPRALLKAKPEDTLIADFNGDLLPDVWLVMRKNRKGRQGNDFLFLNTGSGFVDASKWSGLKAHRFNSRNASAGDFDNDGDIDVYEVNADWGSDFINGNLPNVFWENTGNKEIFENANRKISVPIFIPRSGSGYAPSEDNGLGSTVAMADFNNDGMLDLLVANGGKNGQKYPEFFSRGTYDFYLGNSGKNNGWLLLELVGTQSNTEGIGAVVYATVNEKKYLRTADHGIHFKTQNDPRLHFGFGKVKEGDLVDLLILWPSGIKQELNNIEPNQILKVQEPFS